MAAQLRFLGADSAVDTDTQICGALEHIVCGGEEAIDTLEPFRVTRLRA